LKERTVNGENDFALVRRIPSAVRKLESGAERVLSVMVADTFALAKRSPPLRIIHVEFQAEWLFEFLELAIRDKHKNATIKEFLDGDLAWRELLRVEPDLLITTLCREKGLNGFDMVSRLAERKAKCPVLVYDGLMDKLGEDHVLRLAGPNLNVTCLYCPFSLEQFYQALSKLLGPIDNLEQGIWKVAP
jgi:hypothetical protein